MVDEPIVLARAAARSQARTYPQGGADRAAVRGRPRIQFNRYELNRILNIYGRMVVAGEWRDYAIDFLDDVAVFSAYRQTSEMPLYRIEKRPKLKDRQGQYAVVGASGQILRRGHDLQRVLRVLERKLFRAVGAAE